MSRTLLGLSVLLASAGAALGQGGPASRSISDHEAAAFVSEALALDLPEDRVSTLHVLVLNRAPVVVPKLLAFLESRLTSAEPSSRAIDLAADTLAYSCTEVAVDALVRLSWLDAKRFRYYLTRTLDYCHGRRNPYYFAYYILKSAGPDTGRSIVAWVASNASRGHGYKAWAEAVRERTLDMKDEDPLVNDPLASRLAPILLAPLRSELSKASRQ